MSSPVPSLKAARIAGEYASLFDAATNSECIRSMAGIMLAMQGVSLENSSVTVLNIYKNVRSYSCNISYEIKKYKP